MLSHHLTFVLRYRSLLPGIALSLPLVFACAPAWGRSLPPTASHTASVAAGLSSTANSRVLRLVSPGIANLGAATWAEQPTTTTPRWPWWLRILALIGVVLFVRAVNHTVRKS